MRPPRWRIGVDAPLVLNGAGQPPVRPQHQSDHRAGGFDLASPDAAIGPDFDARAVDGEHRLIAEHELQLGGRIRCRRIAHRHRVLDLRRRRAGDQLHAHRRLGALGQLHERALLVGELHGLRRTKHLMPVLAAHHAGSRHSQLREELLGGLELAFGYRPHFGFGQGQFADALRRVLIELLLDAAGLLGVRLRQIGKDHADMAVRDLGRGGARGPGKA